MYIKNKYQAIVRWMSVFLVVIVAKYFDADVFLFPLVALCAGDSGDSGDSAGACSSGDCGDATGPVGSTPFLCTWNGQSFEFENDVLFGKPTSIFMDEQSGRTVYEQGLVTGDLYRINNSFQPKEGRLAFQIKEIEPEESYIDHLSLLQVTHPVNSTLVVNASFEDFLVLGNDAIKAREGVRNFSVRDQIGQNISDRFEVFPGTQDPSAFLPMQTGDSLELRFDVDDKNAPLYILLGSRFRDWTLGEVFTKADTSFVKDAVSDLLSQRRTPVGFAWQTMRVMTLLVVVGVAWIFGGAHGALTKNGSGDQLSDAGKLAETFGVQTARADVIAGCPDLRSCLVVEYKTESGYKQIDALQPRYFQKNIDALLIPKEAIQDSGNVHLRVRATMRHDVSDMAVIAPKQLLPYNVQVFPVTKAFHQREGRDYAKILNEKQSGAYLHTLPADVVDIEFGLSELESQGGSQKEKTETYLMQAHGYYTPLSQASRVTAGNWVDKLDPESREWLRSMYAREDYYKQDRKPVL